LKIEAVEWTLWDIFKLVSTTEIETVEAAYMVVAAKPNTWGSRRDCVELFDLAYDAEELEQVEWDSRFLFSHYKKAWQDLLGGGTGRPRRVPDSIVISPVGSWPLPAYPPYELRAVRVSRATASRDWLIFEGDWPTARSQHQQATGDRPRKIATDDLTVADLPATDAPEDAYHAFALSFDGYRELGSIKRSGRIANQSLERWRQTRQLPNTTTELRGCLFFEQRRWHHFGYGFDQETMEYLRAVIDKIRSLLTVE